MAATKKRLAAGLTFVEILIAAVVLLIALLGTSTFRYNAALGVRKAELQTTAARTALLLCEAWQGLAEPNDFEPDADLPEGSGITIVDIGTEAADFSAPDGFTLHGVYRVTADDVDYYAVLSWRDIAAGLRALNVVVAWNQRGYSDDDGAAPDKSFALTTYISN